VRFNMSARKRPINPTVAAMEANSAVPALSHHETASMTPLSPLE
jgi:hypothetical protein